MTKEGTFEYTKEMRNDLLRSLELRFKDVEENDAYLFSTYLDPVFGYKAFDKQVKQIVKNKIVTAIQVEAVKENVKQNTLNKSNLDASNNSKADEKQRNNYIFYDEPEITSQVDDIENECEEYVRTIKSSSYNNPLGFC